MKPSLLQKAAIIPVARCINFYLPGCVNLQVPVTLASYKGSDGQAVYTIEVGGKRLNVREISAGGKHTCAITDSGGVKCWGG